MSANDTTCSRDEYDRIRLPEVISGYQDAADVALALTEYFDSDAGFQDDALANLSDTIQTVCRVRANEDIDDSTRYGSRVTYVDGNGDSHTGLVMEPEVGSMRADEAWDPYYEEYVNPDEAYPLGTVQLIYTPEFNLSEGFNFDRIDDIEVATSVAPAKGPDMTHCYYAGWHYAINNE